MLLYVLYFILQITLFLILIYVLVQSKEYLFFASHLIHWVSSITHAQNSFESLGKDSNLYIQFKWNFFQKVSNVLDELCKIKSTRKYKYKESILLQRWRFSIFLFQKLYTMSQKVCNSDSTNTLKLHKNFSKNSFLI